MPHPLIDAWRGFTPADAPFVLPADQPLLQALEGRPGMVVHRSLAEYTASAGFGAADDRRLHLGLLPVPYVGVVETASIYLLMLNPSLAAADYFAEWQEASYAKLGFTELERFQAWDAEQWLGLRSPVTPFA
jgi:hypothetical protein